MLALIELERRPARSVLAELAGGSGAAASDQRRCRASLVNPEVFVGYIRVAALLAAAGGDADKASTLFSAVDRLVRETGFADLALPPDRAALDGVRRSLGADAFGGHSAMGRA